jgi:hypothetical protein
MKTVKYIKSNSNIPDLTYGEYYDVIRETSFIMNFVWIVNDFGEIHPYDMSWFEVVEYA